MAHLNNLQAVIPTGPANAPPTSWKSSSIQQLEKYARLQNLGFHAGFKQSPWFPRDVNELNFHNAEWQRQKAEEMKKQLEVKLKLQSWKIERSGMWEPVVVVNGRVTWERKKKRGKGKGIKGAMIDIGRCMEVVKELDLVIGMRIGVLNGEEMLELGERVEWYMRAFNERIIIRSVDNSNVEKGLSKVLGLPSEHWKGNEAALLEQRDSESAAQVGQKCRAYWPSHAELKAEGDDRAKKGDQFRRRLPMPRLDQLSEERQVWFWDQYAGGPAEAKTYIKAMMELSGHNIKPEHRMVVPYEGRIDHLHSVASKYEEHEKDLRNEDYMKKKRADREEKAMMGQLMIAEQANVDFPPLPSQVQFFQGNQGILNPVSTVVQYSAQDYRSDNNVTFPDHANEGSGQENLPFYPGAYGQGFNLVYQNTYGQGYNPGYQNAYGQDNNAPQYGGVGEGHGGYGSNRSRRYTGGQSSRWINMGTTAQNAPPLAAYPAAQDRAGLWGLEYSDMQEDNGAWYGYENNTNFPENMYGFESNRNFQENNNGHDNASQAQQNMYGFGFKGNRITQETNDNHENAIQASGDGFTEPATYVDIRVAHFDLGEESSEIPEDAIEEKTDLELQALVGWNELGLDV